MMGAENRMVKLKDVAASAGVSTATVSLVLNKKPGVNARTREKVLQASHTLGYTPNTIARGLATQRSRTIGLIVTDIENPFFATVTKYMDQFTKEAGYGLIFEITNDDLAREENRLKDFIGRRVEGLVIVPTLRTLRADFSIFDRLRSLKIPCVFLTSYYPGHECHCVMTDLERGSYLITRHLVRLGHRDIVLLAPHDTHVIPAALRIKGFMRALKESRCPFKQDMIVRCQEPNFRNGYEKTAALIRRRKPDAIMAINDILALGANRAITEAGYRVPRDIAVAGFDDVIFASISEVPLTTVKQDVPEMCRLAVQDLTRLLALKDPCKKRFLFRSVRPELIVRASTDVGRASS
jgi:LacI family transcriptional regulator